MNKQYLTSMMAIASDLRLSGVLGNGKENDKHSCPDFGRENYQHISFRATHYDYEIIFAEINLLSAHAG